MYSNAEVKLCEICIYAQWVGLYVNSYNVCIYNRCKIFIEIFIFIYIIYKYIYDMFIQIIIIIYIYTYICIYKYKCSQVLYVNYIFKSSFAEKLQYFVCR